MCRALRLCLHLALLAVAGCSWMPPLRTEAEVGMTMRQPVRARVQAEMNTLPDHGPFQEVQISSGGPGAGKVAVIDVDGLLLNRNQVGPYSMGENPLPSFQEKLNAAAADPNVRAVVLRLNSPGGSVAATEMMWRALTDFRRSTHKPVVACLMDVGAGGAYFLASACDQVVAAPTSVVGGIGVMLNLYFLELSMEQWNVFQVPIKAGERIDMGTPTRKMTAEEKAMLTAMAKEYHADFKSAVLEGRPRVKAGAEIFDGRVMSAAKALDAGLIDLAGYLPDAVERAKELGGVPGAAVVMYRRCGSSARSIYDVVPDRPVQILGAGLPSVPGLDRSNLPMFLYIWSVEPTLVKVSGPY